MEAHIEGSSEVYKAERKGGVCKHCKQDGDRLILFFDNHNLVEGRLLMELTIEYPDPDYSEDGIRQEHFVEIAPIQIVADNGDALDLRLPEPKVVEKVVEKIVEKVVEVEKPVEKIVEKVVEKVVDPYTDLQKKAADWVGRMEKEIIAHPEMYPEEQGRFEKVLGIFFKQIWYADLQSVSPMGMGEKFLFGDVSSSDEDFEDRIEFSKFLLGGSGGYSTSYLYSSLNAPELDLTITLPDSNKISYVGLFYSSTLNNITINATGGSDFLSERLSWDDLIDYYRGLSIFNSCTANKVTVRMYSDTQDKKSWYLLSTIDHSNVKCFEFSGGNTYNQKYRIDNIIEKLLPNVTSDSHKPNLIFRDYTGEATEELKQKVLDKGYLSVEFYKGDTKVL